MIPLTVCNLTMGLQFGSPVSCALFALENFRSSDSRRTSPDRAATSARSGGASVVSGRRCMGKFLRTWSVESGSNHLMPIYSVLDLPCRTGRRADLPVEKPGIITSLQHFSPHGLSATGFSFPETDKTTIHNLRIFRVAVWMAYLAFLQ